MRNFRTCAVPFICTGARARSLNTPLTNPPPFALRHSQTGCTWPCTLHHRALDKIKKIIKKRRGGRASVCSRWRWAAAAGRTSLFCGASSYFSLRRNRHPRLLAFLAVYSRHLPHNEEERLGNKTPFGIDSKSDRSAKYAPWKTTRNVSRSYRGRNTFLDGLLMVMKWIKW